MGVLPNKDTKGASSKNIPVFKLENTAILENGKYSNIQRLFIIRKNINF